LDDFYASDDDDIVEAEEENTNTIRKLCKDQYYNRKNLKRKKIEAKSRDF